MVAARRTGANSGQNLADRVSRMIRREADIAQTPQTTRRDLF
jgi:hypothetical protein